MSAVVGDRFHLLDHGWSSSRLASCVGALRSTLGSERAFGALQLLSLKANAKQQVRIYFHLFVLPSSISDLLKNILSSSVDTHTF